MDFVPRVLGHAFGVVAGGKAHLPLHVLAWDTTQDGTTPISDEHMGRTGSKTTATGPGQPQPQEPVRAVTRPEALASLRSSAPHGPQQAYYQSGGHSRGKTRAYTDQRIGNPLGLIARAPLCRPQRSSPQVSMHLTQPSAKSRWTGPVCVAVSNEQYVPVACHRRAGPKPHVAHHCHRTILSPRSPSAGACPRKV